MPAFFSLYRYCGKNSGISNPRSSMPFWNFWLLGLYYSVTLFKSPALFWDVLSASAAQFCTVFCPLHSPTQHLENLHGAVFLKDGHEVSWAVILGPPWFPSHWATEICLPLVCSCALLRSTSVALLCTSVPNASYHDSTLNLSLLQRTWLLPILHPIGTPRTPFRDTFGSILILWPMCHEETPLPESAIWFEIVILNKSF